MKILVLHYYKSIVDGVMTSLIDGYYNMRDNLPHDVEMKIFCPELYSLEHDDYYNFPLDKTQWHEYTSNEGLETVPYEDHENDLTVKIKMMNNKLTTAIPFLKMNRNFGDFGLFYFIEQKQRKYKADMIVCSARLIYEIMMGKADIEFDCKRLVVLDSLDTYKCKIGMFPDFDDYFDTLKGIKITQLSNPATFRETKYEQKEYYHKFSETRLRALRQSNILSDNYTYTRKRTEKGRIGDGYYENIGKCIFERLWCGKTVHYKTDGMFTKDGLYFYLERVFGIDPEKDQTLKINKGDIRYNLYFERFDGLHLREKDL